MNIVLIDASPRRVVVSSSFLCATLFFPLCLPYRVRYIASSVVYRLRAHSLLFSDLFFSTRGNGHFGRDLRNSTFTVNLFFFFFPSLSPGSDLCFSFCAFNVGREDVEVSEGDVSWLVSIIDGNLDFRVIGLKGFVILGT